MLNKYTSKEKIRKAHNHFKDQRGLLRTSDVLSAGIRPGTLYKIRDEGYTFKLDRRVYKLNDHVSLSNPNIAIAAARVQMQKLVCFLGSIFMK